MLRIISCFLLVMMCVTSVQSHASFRSPYSQDWTHIRTLGDYNVYHKASYINIVDVQGQKRMNTWAKYVARDTKPNMMYLRKDDYVLVQLQFICPTRQYAILSGTTYLSQGRVSRASAVDQPMFSRIQPKSVEARIASRVCKNIA